MGWNVKKDFAPPVIPKSDEQKNRLKAVLSKSFMFASLDDSEFNIIIGAMKEIPVAPKTRIIQQKDDVETFENNQVVVTQGETGHKFYIIEEGGAVAVKNDVEVMQYAAGDYFGELAIIKSEDQVRAATVKAKGASKLLSIDRATFVRLLDVTELLART